MKLKVHLVLPETCEETLNFYKETLAGEIDFIFRKKEDSTADIPENEKEKISQIWLRKQNTLIWLKKMQMRMQNLV